jgi:hypothetical protein
MPPEFPGLTRTRAAPLTPRPTLPATPTATAPRPALTPAAMLAILTPPAFPRTLLRRGVIGATVRLAATAPSFSPRRNRISAPFTRLPRLTSLTRRPAPAARLLPLRPPHTRRRPRLHLGLYPHTHRPRAKPKQPLAPFIQHLDAIHLMHLDPQFLERILDRYLARLRARLY